MHEHRADPDVLRAIYGLAAVLFLAIVLGVLVWLFVERYWGPFGVQVVGVFIGLGVIIKFVHWLYMSSARMVAMVHNATVAGIIAHQAADDRGEVARMVAQNSLEGNAIKLNQLATRIADEQAKRNEKTPIAPFLPQSSNGFHVEEAD